MGASQGVPPSQACFRERILICPHQLSDGRRRLVVVSEKIAEAMCPGHDAVGQQLRIGGDKLAQVDGVAADVRTRSMERRRAR